MSIRYVVVEWNQASGQPRIMFNGELFSTHAEAEEEAAEQREQTRAVGRREEHTVHEIDLERP